MTKKKHIILLRLNHAAVCTIFGLHPWNIHPQQTTGSKVQKRQTLILIYRKSSSYIYMLRLIYAIIQVVFIALMVNRLARQWAGLQWRKIYKNSLVVTDFWSTIAQSNFRRGTKRLLRAVLHIQHKRAIRGHSLWCVSPIIQRGIPIFILLLSIYAIDTAYRTEH